MIPSKMRTDKNRFWIAGVFLALVVTIILLPVGIAAADTMNDISSGMFPMVVYYHSSLGWSSASSIMAIKIIMIAMVLIVVGGCTYYFIVVRRKRERRNR